MTSSYYTEKFFPQLKTFWLWLFYIPSRTIIIFKFIQMDGFSLYFNHLGSQGQRTYEFLCNWVSCFPVQHIHPTDLLRYCYVHKVAHLYRIFIEVFLRRKRLGCRKNVCYHCYLSGAFGGVGNLAQYHFVGVFACGCVCVEDVFSLLSMCPWLCKCTSFRLV